MLYLVLHVLAAALFSTCYKIADRKEGYRTSAVLFFMYMGAAGFCIPMALFYEGFVADGRLIAYGLVAGLFLFLAMFTFFRAMTQGGLAIGWTFVSLAVTIPILASVVIWKEFPTPLQVFGIALMVPCLLLFGDLGLSIKGSTTRWLLLVIVASVTTGVLQTFHKAVALLEITDSAGNIQPVRFNYLGWMFGVGILLLILAGEWRQARHRPAEMKVGFIMASLNAATLWTFVRALEGVAGIVFYPTKGVCGVILTALLAVLIWKEKLTRRQAIGIGLGAVSVLLVNIK